MDIAAAVLTLVYWAPGRAQAVSRRASNASYRIFNRLITAATVEFFLYFLSFFLSFFKVTGAFFVCYDNVINTSEFYIFLKFITTKIPPNQHQTQA